MTHSHCSHLNVIDSFQIHFGLFQLLPKRHLLLKNGQPVPLGSRAISLLIALASRPGELLKKTELLNIAWPRLVVEECNLRAQIKAIRRVLGDEDSLYIATAAGQGYRFVAPTSIAHAASASLLGCRDTQSKSSDQQTEKEPTKWTGSCIYQD
jgi:DNA-binding winged helix-turn-helix (wHTH) protein